ncbi:polymeric immunoglobulin receptor-like [Hemibagrus wyckioides]|uniref:polymeric immunoglobulin receptor-like n=1 Tax=Hemibagrus wyckioides TaxID=337641 RepID=UPI00266C1E78|nr:polymeric immunoglobulin receptor-like [Hemibagrus wyckioides]
MMKCLYLLSVVFHVAAGCYLSANSKDVYNGLQGGSVLLLCSCSDLNTKPQTFTWMTFRTGSPTDVLNDEHYRGRLQLFNNISPGNLSLFISDLREEDQGVYRCSTEKKHRDIRINVKGCDLSGDNDLVEITQHQGGSVLLPCSCSDLNTKPQTFTWMTFRTGSLTDVLNDEHYRGRLQLFNNISPGNLSLFISDLREEDQGDYRCSTEKEYRDMKINVKAYISHGLFTMQWAVISLVIIIRCLMDTKEVQFCYPAPALT